MKKFITSSEKELTRVSIKMGKISKALEKSSTGFRAEEEHTGEEFKHPLPEEGPAGIQTELSQSAINDIPFNGKWDERLVKVAGFSGGFSESFRVLRSRIIHPSEQGRKQKTILVTSAAPSEGKSFVAANLAILLAQGMDQHCLAVDCDLRNPSLAGLFGLKNQPGLSDHLLEKCDVSHTIQKTSIEKLSLIASGHPPVNPSELLGSIHMQGLVHQLASRYEDRFIIFDSPPMGVASETSVLAKQVDCAVVVVRWGVSGREHIKKLVEDIGREKIIGVVFNGSKMNILERKMFTYPDYYRHEYASK